MFNIYFFRKTVEEKSIKKTKFLREMPFDYEGAYEALNVLFKAAPDKAPVSQVVPIDLAVDPIVGPVTKAKTKYRKRV